VIWVTWQQHRLQALVGGVSLALLAVFVLVTGQHMRSEYRQLGVASCLSTTAPLSARCADIVTTFQQDYGTTATLLLLLFILTPLVVGILIGAPLVAREVEQGTYLLAWTQGITRRQWLVVKVAAILATAVLAWAGMTLLVSWWRVPLDHLESPLAPLTFDVEGLVPVTSMILALCLAIAAGTVLRRTILAIAVTIVIYLAILLPTLYQRYYVLPPKIVAWDSFTQSAPAIDREQGGWVIAQGTLDHQGHVVPDVTVNSTCNGVQDYTHCLHNHGWLHFDAYLPTGRFWALQGMEAGLWLGLAVILLTFTIWWIAHRLR
jgi:hypothetical protein